MKVLSVTTCTGGHTIEGFIDPALKAICALNLMMVDPTSLCSQTPKQFFIAFQSQSSSLHPYSIPTNQLPATKHIIKLQTC